MSSKRSLLDLLPQPKQRQSQLRPKRPKTDEESAGKKGVAEHVDNEQFRVNLSAAETMRAPVTVPPVIPAKEQKKEKPNKAPEIPADEVIMKAFEEEQTRARKSKKGRPAEIEFKEISQDSLKSGVSAVQREVDAIGLALKADADEDDKVVMPEYTLSKEAHKKHQITTLYQTMKKNETKMMTKDAQNARTRRETERKYGWR